MKALLSLSVPNNCVLVFLQLQVLYGVSKMTPFIFS